MNPTPDTNTPRVSSSRLAANRRNAKRSTGPKTAPGKQRSAQNACRHGLTRRNAWSGKGQSADGFTQAWARIGPRSPQEVVESANLLQCRADEQMLLAAETLVVATLAVVVMPVVAVVVGKTKVVRLATPELVTQLSKTPMVL